MSDTEKLDLIIREVGSLKTDINNLQHSMRNMERHLENVTDQNIRFVAERHLDLKNKLSEAINVGANEKMIGIRLNILEEDVRLLKEAVAINPA